MADASSALGRRDRVAVPSGNRLITLDWFRAAKPGPRPAVLMLHGRDGPHRFAEAYHAAAEALTEHGYHVLFAHYFEGTDDITLFGAAGLSNFIAWTRVVGDIVTWTAAWDTVDPARLALLGVSLGAAIAIAQAGHDPRIKAVVEFYGMLPAPALALLRRMPPTLILHGARDWLVPVAAAYQLESFLRARGTVYDMHIYPDQGHGFTGAAGADAVRRTVSFLDRHLAVRH